MMKFMRISQRQNTSALSPEKQSELSAATMAFHDKYVKSGKCTSIYWLFDGRTMSVWELSSIEELYRITAENPMRPYLLSEETAPIMDYQDVLKMREAQAAAARKGSKK